MSNKIITEKISIPGREEIFGQLEIDDNGIIQKSSLKVIGGPDLIRLAEKWRSRMTGGLGDLSYPVGTTTAEMLMRELILKLKGQWKYPYEAEEVCHCRVVACETIDRAIVVGAHTPKKVSEWTSASTACGTCRPDVEAMIAYRLAR
ncbi:MAG: (2Fe-2S)-binding protein [Bdellovibrionota bacterium]